MNEADASIGWGSLPVGEVCNRQTTQYLRRSRSQEATSDFFPGVQPLRVPTAGAGSRSSPNVLKGCIFRDLLLRMQGCLLRGEEGGEAWWGRDQRANRRGSLSVSSKKVLTSVSSQSLRR